MLGAHKFYEEQIGTGILYLCTFGLFGIGSLINFSLTGDIRTRLWRAGALFAKSAHVPPQKPFKIKGAHAGMLGARIKSDPVRGAF